MRASLPSIRIRPLSGCSMPDRIPISVDFPAPFSPSRQCTSPRYMVRLIASLARTPGNCLVTSTSSTAADGRSSWSALMPD